MSRRSLRRRSAGTLLLALLVTMGWSSTALAQLDPLLFIKRTPPTVIIVVDTSVRMLEDGNGTFYDPHFYVTADDAAVMSAFNFASVGTAKTYRRVYRNLQYGASSKYTADSISATAAVWDPAVPATSNNAADQAFLDPTRYNIAKQGISAAVSENGGTVRFGLIRLRQSTPAWRASGNCDKPVLIASDLTHRDANPCSAGGLGNYAIYAPSVAAASYAQAAAPAGTVVVAPAANTYSTIATIMGRGPDDAAALIPAGIGGVGYEDRPLTYALDDAKTAATTAMTGDTAACKTCRNTIVVLITSGKDSGDATYAAAHNAATTASSFLAYSGTRRLPIYVVAIKPPAADEASLQSIATNSGGTYRNVSTAADVTAAIDRAVQAGFTHQADFDTSKASEFLPGSPIVGTVNLENAKSSTGASLPNTNINATPGGQHLPQRSNMLITSGFALPGFDGVLRAFRAYKPATDATKSTGWKFVSDGTPLWPDLDGRPSLAGKARVPADPNTRNVFTYIPDGSGGGSVVAFTAANLATLSPHMAAGSAASSVISAVRAQPLGAIIGSTPGLMDAPSLDPPPDDDYGRTDAPATFAGIHKDRRSIIFVGANDGMIHAIDARTGYEVWAFIPYNLLPKLRTLVDGQPVEQFDYFVDSSPKIAEVKLSDGWHSLLIMGEGQGGIFYQAFDVSETGMGVDPTLDDLGTVSTLLSKFDTPNESVTFKWAYPNYSSFDPAITQTFTVTDGTPGGKFKVFGDLKATASLAEKTVGLSWSDPAVGALDNNRVTTAVIVGSGYFPDIETSPLLNRGGATAPKAGTAMYLLNVETGQPLGNATGASCPTISSGVGSGMGCAIIGDVSNGRKNALQADPTAAGSNGTVAVNKAYIGDIDGKYWRFNFTNTGSIAVTQMVDTGVPIYASSALLFVGSVDTYMFFATGSDLLSSSAPGGTGTFRLYGLKDQGNAAALTKFARDLATVSNSSGLATGERASTAPSVAGDIVFYTTTVESATTPCADFAANLYGLTFSGGAAYDSNGDGQVGNNENPVVKTLAGRATAPFIVDQHLYVATSSVTGANVEAFGDAQDFNNGIGQVGVKILSWREIR